MKNNYPIRYAIIPMKEQIGWSHGMHELERKFGTVYYIVSKCYLVGESKKYKIDGSVEERYQVVCPYKEENYNIWNKDEPSYNLINGLCTNSIFTDTLFDTYDEARIVKDEKNRELLNNMFRYICFPIETYKKRRKEIEDEFNNKKVYYDELESEIEKRTKDLSVYSIPKEQSVISFKDNKCKKMNSSLYEVVSLFDTDNYIVYCISDEDFVKLQNSIDSDIPLDNYNYQPLLIHNKDLKVTKVLSSKDKETYLVKNELVNYIDGSFNIPSEYDVVFYTVENYDDIIKSYNNKSDKNNIIKLIKRQ